MSGERMSYRQSVYVYLFCLCVVLIFRCQLVWKLGMGIWRRIAHREEHMGVLGNGWKPKIVFPLLWFLMHYI